MNIHKFTILFIALLANHLLIAQCGITVDAGPDQAVCGSGGNVNLNGMLADPNVLSTVWTPAPVADPNSLNTSAFVTTPTTFTLTAQVVDLSSNSVSNGDFNGGLTGFTSDYIEGTGGSFGLLSSEGQYAVTTNSSLVHNNFAVCNDHTGGGSMLVVNGATAANADIWCQDLAVSPLTNYVFSFWGQTVVSSNPGILQFNINGFAQGGLLFLPATTCQWEQFSANWFSGGNTTATLCITNQNNQQNGNDFAIDDIIFAEVCEQSDDIFVDVIPLNALVNPMVFLSCTIPSEGTTLDGSNSSSGPNITYQWTTIDGNIITDPTDFDINVDAVGTYTLLVTNTTNGCTAQSDVIVVENNALPDAIATADGSLDCDNTQVSLNGTGSATGNVSYEWTTPNGNILNGNTTLTPTVNATGIYILTVTDNQTGCTNTAEVTVEGSSDLPVAVIETPQQINCNNDPVLLDASNSSITGNFAYQWSTPDGNFSNLSNIMMVEVNMVGTYILIVTNEDSGCTAITSVMVTLDNQAPEIEIETPDFIDCSDNEVTITANNMTMASGFLYEWNTADGNLTGGIQSLTPTVDAIGTYTLTVTNQDTGCTADFSVEVAPDANTPIVEFAPADSLTCAQNSVIINAQNSSSGANYSFNWSTADGNFLAGENTLQPEVDAVGTYVLTIMDNTNNCETSASIIINENVETPTVEAGLPFVLNCTNPTGNLNLTGSDSGANFTVLWTTADGNITGDATSTNPEIDEAGNYVLTITNTATGCTATDFVAISNDFTAPTADAGMSVEITCTEVMPNLDGGNSSTGADFSYAWSTQNGNITQGENSLNPTINAAGDYQLIVTDASNGCTAMSMIAVTENVDFPAVNAGQTAELTCALAEITLAGNGSQGNEFMYQWTTTDGNIVQNDNTLTPAIDAAGDYQLVITNTQNDCSATANVVITEDTTPPDVEAGNTFELSCSVMEANLEGSTSGANFTYFWTSPNGNILVDENTLMPLINAPGMYQLIVTNPANGCTAADQIQITQDANAPTADAGTADPITCLINMVELDASNSANSPTITYEWATANGNILTGQNTLTPQVNAPGTYILTVTDSANDCETISSVTVAENTALPTAEAGNNGELTCIEMMLNLDAQNSSQGNEFVYEWTTADGNILNGVNTLNPVINAAGIYQILITNTETGCTNTDELQITENQSLPTAFSSVSEEIDCINETVLIDGNGTSTGNQFVYEWTTQNGEILQGENTLSPEVGSAGMYQILVTNTDNGCTVTNEVEVLENIDLPTAEAGQLQTLTCEFPALNLDGNGTSMGTEFAYQWTTQNGNIANGATTLNPEINTTGIYQIVVTNTANNCTATDEVTIDENTVLPDVLIASPDDLTCIKTLVNLNATDSDSGANFQYEWSTTNGNITAGENTLTPEVNATGNYLLTITNTENGCTETASIAVAADIQLPTAEAGATQTLHCNLQTTMLEGSGNGIENLAFTWQTTNGIINSGGNSATPIISQPGVYILIVTDEINGCTNTDEVEITEIFLNDFAFSTEDANCTIPTGSLNFGAIDGGQAPYLYSIDGGQSFTQTAAFQSLQPTNYQLVIQDVNGCELEDAAFIAEAENVLLSLESQVILKLGTTYQINLQATVPDQTITEISWSPAEGLSCTDCMNPIASPTQETVYTVNITDENGCTAATKIVFFIDKKVEVFFPNVFSPNGDGENENFYAQSPPNTVANIPFFQIFDRWGNSVYEVMDAKPNDPNFGWNGIYHGKMMNPGVYIFVAEVEFVDGQKELFTGDFTLLR